MKTKTKKVIALSLTATLCGALATMATFANGAEVSANATPTFKMADGAGIRYTQDKQGLRFIVLADETTKDAIVASGEMGAIISIADDFTGIDGDYLNRLDEMQYETNATIPVTEEMFYKNAEEYGDLYCANIVINMGTNDTVENFTERTYSAVAYYATGTDTYAYTANRQERSIQDVASKLYMQGDDDWAKVSEAYTELGTESTPFLVAQSGDNSFDALVSNLTKNADFAGEYAFEMEDGVTVDTTVIDSTNAEDLGTSIAGTAMELVQMQVGFDETKKYDSASNGSYKIDYKMADDTASVASGNAANMTMTWKVAHSKAYYVALKLCGYDNIAVRYYSEAIDDGNRGNYGMYYIDTGTGDDAKTPMQIYTDNAAVVNKASTYVLWEHELSNSFGKWSEMVLDIDRFINSCYATMSGLVLRITLGQVDMTMYIDNICAVKGFIGETKDTVYQDKGTQVSIGEDRIATATLDGKEVAITDNKVILDNYGVYTIKESARDCYGYVETTVIPNGTVVSKIAENFSAVQGTATWTKTDFSIRQESDNGMTIVADSAMWSSDNWQRVTYTMKPACSLDYYTALKDAGYNYISYEYVLDYGENTFAASTSVYRAALTQNKLTHYNSLTATTAATHQWKKVSDGTTGDTSTKASNIYFQSTSYADSQWKGEMFIISVSIDDFIKFYNTNGMNMLTLYFSKAQTFDYSVTFGQIAATKTACAFE